MRKNRFKLSIGVLVVLGLLFCFVGEIQAGEVSIAIANFETDRDYRSIRDDLDRKMLNHVLNFHQGEEVTIKERLRKMDILRDVSISRSDRRRLQENLGADYIILPQIDSIKVEETGTFSFSLSSKDSKGAEINFGIEKVIVEVELSARVVNLKTGTIEKGINVEKDEIFSVGKVKINNRNILREKEEEVLIDLLDPAIEELSLLVITEIENMADEFIRENATIVEVAPYGIKEYLIAEITSDSSRFRTGRIVTIYKPGSIGGRVPVAEAEIIDKDGDFITLELLEEPKVKIEKQDSLQVEY